MPHYKLSDSFLESVSIPGIDNAFIVSNPHLESILFNRNLVGLEFTRACEAASIAFLRHFSPEFESLGDNVAELLLLSKGMYYWLHNAFATVFNRNLQVNFAATRRAEVFNDSARIEIPYLNFDSPSRNLIIGDTIASGATIESALSKYLQHSPLESVYVFTIAGSVVGGQAIAEFCRSHHIDLILTYGLAAFGLGSNGFDLSFLHPDTITNEKYHQRAKTVFKGKPISAVGWDFGTQAQAIRKYKMLCWLEAEYWGLEGDDVFAIKEKPEDFELVEKERAAYTAKYEDSVDLDFRKT